MRAVKLHLNRRIGGTLTRIGVVELSELLDCYETLTTTRNNEVTIVDLDEYIVGVSYFRGVGEVVTEILAHYADTLRTDANADSDEVEEALQAIVPL